MSVTIKQSEVPGQFLVNDKPVRQDMDGNWIATAQELTHTEQRFFGEYIKMAVSSSAKSVQLKATFIV